MFDITQSNEHENVLHCDVLIVGSGAAGLTAAAATEGLNTILIEKQSHVGGTTFRSGGTIWMPNNYLMQSWRIHDSKELGERYVNAGLQQTSSATSGALPETQRRIKAFLSDGPKMIDYLRTEGFKWMNYPSSFPDYHPELDGALDHAGRTLDPAIFDATSLGSWERLLPAEDASLLVFRFQDFRVLTRPWASIRDVLHVGWMALKSKVYSIFYNSPMSMGRSLVAQLLSICHRHKNVRIFTETEFVALWHKNGNIIGGTVKRGNVTFKIRASRGVLFATAGFSRNQQLREKYLKSTNKQWSLSCPEGDTGDALRLTKRVAADAALLGEVWGIPTMKDPITGHTAEAMFAISKPHSIVVSKDGNRFFAESKPYGDAVRSMYTQAGDDDCCAWLILDENYRRRYTLGCLQPWADATEFLQDGIFMRAETIADLGKKMGIDGGALEKTVARWNAMCDLGVDLDYQRGGDAYQRFIGDPSAKPNPCMGRVGSGPFYSIKIFPGDAGTKGGLRIDESGRVLRADGSPIPGLYAAGNASVSFFEHCSLGAGVTIGPAMKDGFAAVRHMLSRGLLGAREPQEPL
ncbi:FAD binding domain-containing protein [Thelonectria olida]|uniref:FAD binding domain-containing protein n=1 Tax=Thelonectria olida TaxID=1576542 RepID=A0A9P8VT69_9HYPO|nr:FAD binding domain-containing protein [Thelonectria olida]